MSRSLSARSNLDALRGEAKRWLKALSEHDSEAKDRFRESFPDAPSAPKLRQVQHALAREYGFTSWTALKQELEDRAHSHADRVRLFLEKSVNRYGTNPITRKWGDYERDRPERGALAARLLERNPAIAQDSIHTAVSAHDLAVVREILAKNPNAANERSEYDGWTPLTRLAYARLPLEAATTHALAIATLLLNAGADPDAGWSEGENVFNVLVGVIGGGEAGQSAHPLAEPFARLLIDRGADPFAPQALYNTSLGADSTMWLQLLWNESEKRDETHKWTGPAPGSLGGAKAASALNYLLGNAVPNHIRRTQWLLEHGADARGVNFYSGKPVITHAALAGREDVMQLLVQYGAVRPQLSTAEQFLAAAVSGDAIVLRRLAAAEPQLLTNHEPMFAVIRHKRTDMAEVLLELGMSPNIGDEKNFRALHYTTHCAAAAIAKLLMEHGAEIDPFELRYGGSPLTHACYQGDAEMIALIARHSRNLRGLCYAAAIERLRELLTETPECANRQDRPGETALFCLPGTDESAVEVCEVLLTFGADPTVKNSLGLTPAQCARRRGFDDAGDLLEEAQKRWPNKPSGS